MIIDCHAHYTTAPAALRQFRLKQLAAADDRRALEALRLDISDDEIRDSLEGAQLRFMRERGHDLTIFSPIAGAMAHHEGNAHVSGQWARVCNDLIARVCALYPRSFAGVCQLPQAPGAPLQASVEELDRCVRELGFVGCNLNPDPSGGYWSGPPLHDPQWFPLYEKMIELDVPAMIHVSSACNPNFASYLGTHYLNGGTTSFMQCLESDLFERFPSLRFVIPHGGGAVPYHWGRYRGLAQDLKRPPLSHLLRNVFFDTCVYHYPGIELLTKVVPIDNILFASEMIGAVRGVDPETGRYYDDTKPFIEAVETLSADDRSKIFEGNARRVYPLLNRRLGAAGIRA